MAARRKSKAVEGIEAMEGSKSIEGLKRNSSEKGGRAKANENDSLNRNLYRTD
ncbi:MAG: hypothetical protein WCY32_09950 [Burkholderiaceae bacterium]